MMDMSSDSMYGASMADLSLSDPMCNNDSCIAYYTAHNASQAEAPWARQFEYGHWTTWYYLILIALFSLLYIHQLLRDRRLQSTSSTPAEPSSTAWYQKANAAVRTVSYRRLSGALSGRLGLPSIGILIFLCAGMLFLAVLTFAVRPYMRASRGYGSPPLAVRAGLMATACTPLLVALSGKANIITMLTGIGHEKLNVFHRWVGWMTLGLSVIHTVPFIVAPLREGGPAALHKQWYSSKAGSSEYSGSPPLAMLFGLVLFSIPQIRKRAYESFYFLHFFFGVAYLGTMFWHCGQTIDSWAYLWATLAVWLFSIIVRVFWYNRTFNVKSTWLEGSSASFTALASGMTRVEIMPPPDFSWSVGQHCFLRLPELFPFDNHPFTITSARVEPGAGVGQLLQPVVFLIRPHSGFTRKLSSYSNSNPDASCTAWLDGPYGGINRPLAHLYDTVVLVAGGSGVSAVLPWLQTLRRAMKAGEGRVNKLEMIWMVRKREHVDWARREIGQALNVGPEGLRVRVRVFVTGETAIAEKTLSEGKTCEEKTNTVESLKEQESSDSDVNGDRTVNNSALGADVQAHRPDIGAILKELVGTGKNVVIACGPESLKVDVSNACAAMQARVLRGDVQEVRLYTESFGW